MKNTFKNANIFLVCSLLVILFLTLILSWLIGATAIALADAAMPTLEEQTEEYTNSDMFTYSGSTYTIEDYKNSMTNSALELYGTNVSCNTTTGVVTISGDDPIINIVPKAYFNMAGTYCFIGREYGFFIKTTMETQGNYTSVILLFDVVPNTDYSNNNSNIEFTVKPLFQRRYSYLLNENSTMQLYTASGSQQSATLSYDISNNYVVPTFMKEGYGFIYFESTEYALKDVNFVANMSNVNHLNYGDSGYVAQNDKGSFFVMADTYYSGEYKNSYSEAETASTIIKTLAGNLIGLLPGGEMFSIVADVAEVASCFSSKYSLTGHHQTDSDFYATRDE